MTKWINNSRALLILIPGEDGASEIKDLGLVNNQLINYTATTPAKCHYIQHTLTWEISVFVVFAIVPLAGLKWAALC